MECLFVSNRFLIPMHDSIIIKISILSAWLCCFSLPFLQWYSIKIVVSINQPFNSKITMLIFTNDPSIIYWIFINDDDCNLPIIIKWWFELGLFNNDIKLVTSNIQEDWFDSDTMEWFERIDIWSLFHFWIHCNQVDNAIQSLRLK